MGLYLKKGRREVYPDSYLGVSEFILSEVEGPAHQKSSSAMRGFFILKFTGYNLFNT